MPPETPQNGEYLVAAYTITIFILLGYWGTLWRKVKSASREEGRERGRT
ncbi:MAG TPA: hypothetical protein VE420_03690 [Gemmatimonadales bacterium]|jgi:hypothetical protein|nr:hypothetical protein [Gemmatimonadales bacterium]